MQATSQLLTTMRECKERVKRAIMSGGIVPDIEVTANSFVQIVEWSPKNHQWVYYQCKFESLGPELQKKLLGRWLHETIDNIKIIGVFDWIAPK